jgi:CAAX prenyl protease-like protein
VSTSAETGARRAIFSRALPFLVFIALIGLDPWLAQGATAVGLDPRWLYGVRVILVGLLLAWFWRGYLELDSAGSVGARDWLLALVVGIAVFALWIHLDVPILSFGQAGGFDPRTEGQIDWRLALVRLAGAALLVPVMEELFWRSLVMRWIESPAFLKVDPRRVGWKALAISSALFALEHHLWFAGLLAGLAYGWLYVRTGNLWVPVLAHAVTNLLLGLWILYTGSWRFW